MSRLQSLLQRRPPTSLRRSRSQRLVHESPLALTCRVEGRRTCQVMAFRTAGRGSAPVCRDGATITVPKAQPITCTRWCATQGLPPACRPRADVRRPCSPATSYLATLPLHAQRLPPRHRTTCRDNVSVATGSANSEGKTNEREFREYLNILMILFLLVFTAHEPHVSNCWGANNRSGCIKRLLAPASADFLRHA